MPRTKREVSSTGIYHILLRGYDKLFYSDIDYTEFLNTLHKYFTNAGHKLFAYALSPSAIHLVLFEGELGLSAVMKPICTSYARYINRTYNRVGKLFYDRYKSAVIENGDSLIDNVVYVNKLVAKTSVDEYTSKPYTCDVSLFFKKTDGQATYISRMQDSIKVMCLDDYENMTGKQITYYIQQLTGLSAQKIKALPKQERDAALEILRNQKWISARRLAEVTGVGKSTVSKTGEHVKRSPKPEPTQSPNRELSVWLL